jgi:hypothetical protein
MAGHPPAILTPSSSTIHPFHAHLSSAPGSDTWKVDEILYYSDDSSSGQDGHEEEDGRDNSPPPLCSLLQLVCHLLRVARVSGEGSTWLFDPVSSRYHTLGLTRVPPAFAAGRADIFCVAQAKCALSPLESETTERVYLAESEVRAHFHGSITPRFDVPITVELALHRLRGDALLCLEAGLVLAIGGRKNYSTLLRAISESPVGVEPQPALAAAVSYLGFKLGREPTRQLPTSVYITAPLPSYLSVAVLLTSCYEALGPATKL